MSGVRSSIHNVLLNPQNASLKRLAWAFGCAPKGSDEERQLRDHLLDRAKQELEAKS